MWWITGVLEPSLLSSVKTRREACRREVSGAVSMSAITGSSSSAALTSSADSVPSKTTAQRTAPFGIAMSPFASFAGTAATALSMGVAASAATGATTPTPISCRRRSERFAFSSSAAGISRRNTESLVAMSRRGMPTASFAPRSR